MHSSRMRTVRCSGRLLLGAGGGGGCLPRGVYITTPPVDRILDTRLLKHYLSITTYSDSKNVSHIICYKQRTLKYSTNPGHDFYFLVII